MKSFFKNLFAALLLLGGLAALAQTNVPTFTPTGYGWSATNPAAFTPSDPRASYPIQAWQDGRLASPANFVTANVPSPDAIPTENLFTLPHLFGTNTGWGAVHASCWYGSTNWNGYRYWLFYSDNFGLNNTYEGVSLAVSNDGENWTAAPGTSNGRIGPNAADMESLMLPDGSLCVYYLDGTGNGTTNAIRYMRSFDGLTWSTNLAYVVTNAAASNSVACPSIVVETNGFRLWEHDMLADMDSSDGDPAAYAQVYTRTSSDGTNWSSRTTCPGITNGWHLDVARIGGTYTMLRCHKSPLNQGDPWVFTSTNGVNFSRVPGSGLTNTPWAPFGFYRADIVPTSANPPRFDVWFSTWTTNAVDLTGFQIGRFKNVSLPLVPLDWERNNTLRLWDTFQAATYAGTNRPWNLPWQTNYEMNFRRFYVGNTGTSGSHWTNSGANWGMFMLSQEGKIDANSANGGIFQTYETAVKDPSRFVVQWQMRMLTNTIAQIGVVKFGNFGSSAGTVTNIAVEWNTLGQNTLALTITNGTQRTRTVFSGVSDALVASSLANLYAGPSVAVRIEKTEWGRIKASIQNYKTVYEVEAPFADTSAYWWLPMVAFKGTNGIGLERFDMATKNNGFRYDLNR